MTDQIDIIKQSEIPFIARGRKQSELVGNILTQCQSLSDGHAVRVCRDSAKDARVLAAYLHYYWNGRHRPSVTNLPLKDYCITQRLNSVFIYKK